MNTFFADTVYSYSRLSNASITLLSFCNNKGLITRPIQLQVLLDI